MANDRNGLPLQTTRLNQEPGASGSSLEMTISEEVGRTIKGRYEIVRVIGEGGMGVVYEAYDNQVDRNVAIKLVRNECLADRKFMSRFKRELEVTTQLRHPSTIRVFEHGEAEDGRPYMVMELLTGESLAERLERGRIDEVEALQFARQIAESLSEAHEHGIFHRDLKPDNIFIETVGVSKVVKVLDFGIAGGLDATRLTRAGEVFGTPQYMSPEQCNGHALDHRTDIYSLGCILYEMIEGRPPFAGESPMATMLKHVKSKVNPPRHGCRETAKVLSLALRKDRAKRIQDCGKFAEMLGQAIGAARSSKESNKTGGNPKQHTTGPIAAVPIGEAAMGGSTPVARTKLGTPTKLIAGGLVAGFALLVAAIVFSDMGDDDEAKTDVDESADTLADAPKAGSGVLPKNRATVQTNLTGVKVFVDDEEQCETPCQIQIPVGDGIAHRIVLKKDGYVDVERTWEPKSVVENPPEFADMKPTVVKVGG